MNNAAPSNPYVGPRPFTTRERHMFFGRDREANALIPLVISGRLVLFYAQSGAGKSSLINARLIPGLRERNFQVLPVARVSGQDAGNLAVDNIFTYNLLLNLQSGTSRIEPARLAHMTIQEYMADLEIAPVESEQTAPLAGRQAGAQSVPVDAIEVVEGVQPLALIIDQFEELFTTHPEAWSQRGPFFQQLCEAMEADPYLWVVLSIREDYVAALDPYAYMLPGRLQSRFYMQRMGKQAALEAVKKPVETLRPFDEGVAERLVTNLSQIVISREGEAPMYAEGQYIEPVQLQVVCYQLWENLKDHSGERISEEDLNLLCGHCDLAEFVSQALGQFYEDALGSVIANPDVKVGERQLRAWFSTEVITESETRGAVRQGTERTGSMPNSVVRLLQEKFIIRSETRGGNTWFELSHDRFVSPILQANRAWSDRHPRPVLNDALAWEKAGRDPSHLYEGRQLRAASKDLDANPDDFDDVERDFILAGQAAAESSRSRRQRRITAVFGVALLVLASLLVFATFSATEANRQRATAEYQSSIVAGERLLADNARSTAQSANATAQVDRDYAIIAGQTAEAGKSAAEVAQQEAERQRKLAEEAASIAATNEQAAILSADAARVAEEQAQAGRLSSLSDYYRGTRINLSLLLSVAGYRLSDTWETRRSLLEGVQRGLQVDISRLDYIPFSAQQSPLTSAISPDGRYYALGFSNGDIQVRDMETAAMVNVPAAFLDPDGDKVTAVSFDTNSQFLARSSDYSSVVAVLELASGKVTQLEPFKTFAGKYSAVRDLAFQPNGTLLAIVTDRLENPGNGKILLMDRTNGRLLFEGECSANSQCLKVEWSPDGTKLAAGDSAGYLKVLNVSSKGGKVEAQEGLSRRAHNAYISGLAWYPDSRLLVSGSPDAQVIVWDTDAGREERRSAPQAMPVVLDMAISPDGQYLLIGRRNADTSLTPPELSTGLYKNLPWVSLWDTSTLTPMTEWNKKLLNSHSMPVVDVSFSPQGKRFISLGQEQLVYRWKFEPVNPISQVPEAAAQTGKTAIKAVTAQDGQIWYAQTPFTGQITVNALGQPAGVTIPAGATSLSFGAIDGKDVVVYSDFNNSVHFVDVTTGQETREAVKAANGTIRAVALAQDGHSLAVGFCQSTNVCREVRVRDLNGLDRDIDLELEDQEGYINNLAFSPDGLLLAVGTTEGKIFIVTLATKAIDPLDTDGITQRVSGIDYMGMAFSPQEAGLFAAGLSGGRVGLWKVDRRGSGTDILFNFDPIGDLGELANGNVGSMFFYQQPVSQLWTLVTGSDRGEIREWEVDPNGWINRACKIAGGADLSATEREKFLPGSSANLEVCGN